MAVIPTRYCNTMHSPYTPLHTSLRERERGEGGSRKGEGESATLEYESFNKGMCGNGASIALLHMLYHIHVYYVYLWRVGGWNPKN